MAQELQAMQQDEMELFSYDPAVLLRDVLRHWSQILAAALLAGMVAFVGLEATYRPDYTTNTTFVVSSQGSSSTVYQNLQAASNLASVFSEVLNSSLLRSTILEQLDLPAFDGTIQATAVVDTNLITMQVTGHDPRTTFLVTKSIIENHDVVTCQVLGSTILEVLQDPVVPVSPTNPLNTGAGMKKAALLGGLAMCLLVGLYSYLRDAVRSKTEVENKLNEQVLGELHHEHKPRTLKEILKNKKTSILITNPTASFADVEEIRKLRRQVEHRLEETDAKGKPIFAPGGKVIMVTSVLENEGKSTVAVNLAISLAQKHHKVLLIDGDLRRPACYKVLEQQNTQYGVADILVGRAPLEEGTFAYNKEKNLDLLLEFKSRKHAAEKLSMASAEKLLQTARRQYDYVVVDTAPMSVASDTEALADAVDGTILVIRQNEAVAKVLNSALDALHQSKSIVMGCVLNNMSTPILARIESPHMGGSDYGYGYGNYGRYGDYSHYSRSSHRNHKHDTEGSTDEF